MYAISKLHDFSAAHHLDGLPPEHPCSRLHGHNYRLRITATAHTLDARGFVLDYGDLDPFRRWVDDTLDHRNLNQIMPGNPTAENMARWLTDQANRVIDLTAADRARGVRLAVEVSETPKTWAEWDGQP